MNALANLMFKLKHFFYLFKRCTIFTALIFYFSFNIFAFLIFDTWVPDEKYFWNHTRIYENDIFKIGNLFGYGSIYWWLNILINHFKTLRLINYLYLFSIILLYYLIGKRFKQSNGMILLTFFIFLSFPTSWFYGKIIGPEFLSIFLSLFGFYITLLGKTRYWGFFIIGIGVGVKINSFVILIFALYYLNKAPIRTAIKNLFDNKSLKATCFSILGFIVSTPEFIFNTSEVIINYSIGRLDDSPLINTSLYQAYFGSYRYLWDAIPSSGLFISSINPIILFLIIFLFIFKLLVIENYQLIFSFFLAFVFGTILIMLSKGYIWYWFPIIFLMPIVLFSFKDNRKTRNLLFIIIFFNFFINASNIIDKIENRMLHQKIISHQSDANSFINRIKFENSEFKFLFLTDFGLSPKPKYEPMRLIIELAEEKISNNSEQIDFSENSRYLAADKFANIDSTIVIIGERFLKVHEQIRSLIDKNNCSNSNRFYLDFIDESKFLTAFRIIECD